MNSGGESMRNAYDATQVLDRRGFDTLQAAKLRQQSPATFRANPCHIFQSRAPAHFGTSGTMPHNGESMSFIAYFLYQVESRMVHGQL